MSRPLILFDLTRLLSATGRAAPTGIERVEYQYANWLLKQSTFEVVFVATLSRGIRRVPDESVRAFLQQQSEVWSDGAEGVTAATAIGNINRFLAGEVAPRAPRLSHLSAEERGQRERPGMAQRAARNPISSWALSMASAWAHEKLGPVLAEARVRRRPVIYLRASADRLEHAVPFERLKAQGVRMVVMTHDTIPLDFPEFVRPKVALHCALRLANMARLCDGIIANSHYSASRLQPFLAPHRPKVTVAHLGVDIAPPPTTGLPPLFDAPYFLVISTIEARKNHALLLNLWRRMVDEMGDGAPKLVIAGKRGWEAQTPLAILDRAKEIAPFVYEAGAVPDEALNVLRRRATALLMPSFVEGFGLPVPEALAVDTPVIASDIPVFREIAGEACELIDPLDGPGWRHAITEYADPQSARLAAAHARAQRFIPSTWSAHFTEVRSFLEDIAEPAPASLIRRARRALGTASLARQTGKTLGLERPTDGRPV